MFSENMISLQVIVLLFVVTLAVTSAKTTEYQKQFTKKLVTSLILPYGGENIDYDALADMIVNIADIDRQLVEEEDQRNGFTKRREKRDTNEKPSENLALNEFLRVGRNPSTSVGPTINGVCDICASIVTTLKPIIFNDKVWPKVADLIKQICPRITGGLPDHVCNPIIDSFEPYFRYFVPRLFDSPYTLCDNYFKQLGCGNVDDERIFYEMKLPPKPSNTKPGKLNVDKEIMKVLMVTDMHVDYEYQPGTIVDCQEPVCCRPNSIASKNAKRLNAGFWGEYDKCEIPKWALEDMLRHANETHGNEIDYIYIGGDLAPHDVWNQSTTIHSDLIKWYGSIFDKWFPGTPVFYTLGNHEVVPVNMYTFPNTPTELREQWLYDVAADTWMKWLGSEIANRTIRHAGYYTVLVRPGLRLVSINDNFCIGGNFLQNAAPDLRDPWDLLQWFIDVMTEAEKEGEKVHILTHANPGASGCNQPWSWNYYRIISRFSHIITAQFFGHSHTDRLLLWYDAETLTEPVSFGWVGPPSTTRSVNNIAYRLYEFNSSTFEMENFEVWYSDIDESNSNSNETMIWKLEYSAKEDYKLENLTAKGWADFVERMKTDDDLFQKYFKHIKVSMRKEAFDHSYECNNEACRRSEICEISENLSKQGKHMCQLFYPLPDVPVDENLPQCSARFKKNQS